jgi:hypothetical protein
VEFSGRFGNDRRFTFRRQLPLGSITNERTVADGRLRLKPTEDGDGYVYCPEYWEREFGER